LAQLLLKDLGMKLRAIKTHLFLLLSLGVLQLACVCERSAHAARPLQVLLFSKTSGFRHEAIPDAILALKALGKTRGWEVTATEDASVFTDERLKKFDMSVWLMTSKDVLNDEQQGAFERFIQSGKGIALLHEGTDTEYDWPWFGELIGGAYFQAHPKIQSAKLRIENRDHPANKGVPASWVATDEYYNFRANPRAAVAVLLTVDESTYEAGPGAMGVDHPIAWCRYYDGGRMFHTALGHGKEAYQDPAFLAHVAAGIDWAGGRFTLPGLPANATVILEEFDAVNPNGIWDIHQHPSAFRFDLRKDSLQMYDKTAGYSSPNQHLTRRKLPIDPRRAYGIESQITIHVDGTEGDPSSFCYNVNIAGRDGDLNVLSAWSIPIDYHHQWPPSVMKFMGFDHGKFAQIGERPLAWCQQNVQYSYRLGVNADQKWHYKANQVSLSIRDGNHVVESAEVSFAKFPYQPAPGEMVRIGVNTHGANWSMKNLRVFYLDDPSQIVAARK
jgi:type 1 glutamine amidotransferase